jgi:hypothetical protein
MTEKQAASGARGRGEAYYRRLLREQEASGRSLRAFARERRLSAWTLYGWRVKLGRTRARRGARQPWPTGAGPSFVAVDVVDGADGAQTAPSLEVVLSDGLRVRMPRDTAAQRLVELVRALRSC